jgi:hypothetical protein
VAWFSAGSLGLLSGPAVAAAAAALPAPAPARCEYEVVVGAGGRELQVDARVPDGVPRALDVPDEIAPFVRDLAFEGQKARYRVLLAEAAARDRDQDSPPEPKGVLVVPTSSFVFAPRAAPPSLRCRFHVRAPAGVRFVSGVFPASDGAPDTYELQAGDLDEPPLSAFGDLDTARVELPEGRAEIAIARGLRGPSRDEILAWVERAGRAVSAYYRKFPVSRVLAIFSPGRRGVGYGQTFGNGGASILMPVGADVRRPDLERDWVLTHEMVHLAFPNLPRRHHWLEEGIATYVEPIARARLGYVSAEDVWQGMVEGMPHGLPESGDRGLDRTHTWGRTYWGGALFCLLADVEIREKTQNRRSLDDALRGIFAAGGDIAVGWDLERALRTGDRAVGLTVLHDLHARLGEAPGETDLDALWKKLGVARRGNGKTIVFEDGAPLAAVRRAITTPDAAPRP